MLPQPVHPVARIILPGENAWHCNGTHAVLECYTNIGQSAQNRERKAVLAELPDDNHKLIGIRVPYSTDDDEYS